MGPLPNSPIFPSTLACRLTLTWTFGYDEGKRSAFLWQCIGAAMVTLFPGITYTCEVGRITRLGSCTVA